MLNTMREYLAYSGLQYQKPERAGQEAEKMLYLRNKGQEARKVFTHLAKAFQERHPEWDPPRDESVDESSPTFATAFLGLSTA